VIVGEGDRAAREDDGIAAINASLYILEWMALERRAGPPWS
jgi:hypothetical protein